LKKTENIILRVDKRTHKIISDKAKLFNRKKSDFLRHSALSYWEEPDQTLFFKDMLKRYQDASDEEKKGIVEVLFEYHRRIGFPHTVLTDEQKINRLGRVIGGKKPLLEDDHLGLNHQGTDLANSFHPHMMEAYYNDKTRSPMDTYNDDNHLRDCINRWMQLGKIPNSSGMRRILKTRDGTRGVVNFKPIVAKYIYDTYVPAGGSILDPCAGYSGRLVGAIASGRGILYHGIDPDGRTGKGGMECAAFFSTQYDMFDRREYNYRFKFDLGPAEEVMRDLNNEYDVIFTSTPYYDLERYSEDGNQSYKKHDSYNKWLKDFLFVIVDESKRLLKENGILALNVKNLPKYKICDDLLSYCSDKLELKKTYHMRLANSEYKRNGEKKFHTEPIFIFGRGR
jgi:hypothetical protein